MSIQNIRPLRSWKIILPMSAAFFLLIGSTQAHEATAVTHVPVIFSGGHETDPRDHGRPVVLVASALGVPPDVFRAAFSRVHPAPAGMRPTPEEAQANKAVLLEALSPYGVTNDRLDTVSNYYRYVRSQGQLWPAVPAAGYAIVERGTIKGYVVTRGGSGYSSPPTVTVLDVMHQPACTAQVTFSKSFEANGSVSAITPGLKKTK